MVVKVMDFVGESNTSWDHVVKAAIKQTSQSMGNISDYKSDVRGFSTQTGPSWTILGTEAMAIARRGNRLRDGMT